MKKRTIIIGIIVCSVGVIAGVYQKQAQNQKQIKMLELKREELTQYDGKLAIYEVSALGVTNNGTLNICNINKRNDGTHYKEIKPWNNIEKVSSFSYDVLGITKDKKVVMYEEDRTQMKQEVESWTNIKEVEESEIGTVGLDYQGNVLIASNEGYVRHMKIIHNENMELKNYSDWKDINHISASIGGVVGVSKSGQVKLNTDKYGFKDYKTWNNIISADFCYGTLVGLKNNGIVEIETIEQNMEQTIREVHKWTDIVDVQIFGIAENCMTIMALKSDGTLLAVGQDTFSMEGVLAFKLNCGNVVVLMKDGSVKHIRSSYLPRINSDIIDATKELSKWNLLLE